MTPCTYCSESTNGWLCLACVRRELSDEYEQTCLDCGEPNDGWFGELCDDCDAKLEREEQQQLEERTERVA